MSILLQHERRARQPSGAVQLNEASYWAKSIAFAISGHQAMDVVSGRLLDRVNTVRQEVAFGSGGIGLSGNPSYAANNYWSLSINDPPTNCTIAGLVTPRTLAVSAPVRWGSNNAFIQIRPNSTNWRINLDMSGAATLAVSSLAPSTTRSDFIVGTYDGTTIRIYTNGVFTGSIATSQTSAEGAGTLYIGSDPGTGNSCDTQFTAGWRRTLSDEEVAALYDEYWSIFRPIRRRLWVVPSAGGGVQQGAGSSSLTFTASGVGESTAAAAGSSSVTFAASGVGASTAEAAGTSSLTFTASGVGSTSGGVEAGAGTSSLTFSASAAGVSLFTAAAAGSSSLTFTVTGASTDTRPVGVYGGFELPRKRKKDELKQLIEAAYDALETPTKDIAGPVAAEVRKIVQPYKAADTVDMDLLEQNAQKIAQLELLLEQVKQRKRRTRRLKILLLDA
jgi:hypothetical protein